MGRQAGFFTQRGRIRPGAGVKLATLLLVTLLVTLVLPTLVGLTNPQQDLYAEHDRHGHDAARMTARLLSDRVARNDTNGLNVLLQDLISQSDIVYARVENGAGDILATAGALPGDSTSASRFHDEIRVNGSSIGHVVLGLSAEWISQAQLARERRALWGQGVAILSVVIVVLVAMSSLITRPLAVITGALRTGSRADPPRIEPIPLYGNDEPGELALEINILGRHLRDREQALESQLAATDRELRDAYRRLEVRTTELRELNRELEQHSLTDPLTGLHNQRFFEMLMETEIERCVRNDETISILLIEVNNLPARLAQAGRHGGDELVRGIARVVADHTRISDVSCRYGNCGFFMLCRRATIANAVALADDLQRGLTEHSSRVHDRAQPLTASIGVATIPGVHRVAGAANLLECAEEALRHSRQSGRAVVHYSMLDRHSRSAAL